MYNDALHSNKIGHEKIGPEWKKQFAAEWDAPYMQNLNAFLLREFTGYLHNTLEPEMRAVHADAGVVIEPLSEIPSLDTSAETGIVGLAHELSGSSEIGKVSFGTEGSQYERAGIPAVVCGPGSIEQAHKPNEFVAVDQVLKCERFMRRLTDRMCDRR